MIYNIFPIPVSVVTSTENFTRENEQLNKFETTLLKHSNYGERSVNTYVLDDYRLNNLSRWITQQINLYSSQTLYKNEDVKNYILLQSWISIKYPGQHHTAHTHPNSVISGVYYWEPVEIPITFVNSRTVEIGPTKIEDYTFSIESIQPGSLILFPSYLKHTVSVNTSKVPRKSLAFNSIPMQGFGSEWQLTELNFTRLKNKLLPK